MKVIDRKISIGVLWNLVSLFLSRGATTIFTLFLARMLAPEAFGLVAMATVVFELASAIVNSGLGQALIQSKSVSQKDLCTVFYTNLALSGFVYTVLFLGAPYIALFYQQPELTLLVQVMGLVVFINATRLVQTAILSRAMNFKLQMKANTFATLLAGVIAVSAAYFGLGVWSLVILMLGQASIASLILWSASSWTPSLMFSVESFKRLFSFGRNLLAEGMLEILFQNSYILLIGRFFSAEATGLYFFAKKISALLSQQLTGAVQLATFPALSTLQDDNSALLQKYRNIMLILLSLVAPVMALTAGVAPKVFELIFDEKWMAAVPYLQLLCIVGVLYPVHALNINLLNVKGRSDLVLKVGLFKKTVNTVLLVSAVPYGVFGIVLSQVIGAILSLVPNMYYSSRLVGYSYFWQLRDMAAPLFSSAAALLIVYVLNNLFVFNISIWGGLAASIGVFCLTYFLLIIVFKYDHFKIVIGLILKKSFLRNKPKVEK